jgi:hypothetical protein
MQIIIFVIIIPIFVFVVSLPALGETYLKYSMLSNHELKSLWPRIDKARPFSFQQHIASILSPKPVRFTAKRRCVLLHYCNINFRIKMEHT